MHKSVKCFLAAVSSISMLCCAAQVHADVIYSSTPNQNVNGVSTSDLGSVSARSVNIALKFNADSTGSGGVLVDEVGDSSVSPWWHDSQVEVESNGDVLASLWYYGNVHVLNLGNSSFGVDHAVQVSYNDSNGVLSGLLDGISSSLTSNPGARQTPMEAGTGLIYSFGRSDSTNLGNGAAFAGTISNVVISNTANVPEPGSVALLGLGLLGFVASRRKAAKSTNA